MNKGQLEFFFFGPSHNPPAILASKTREGQSLIPLLSSSSITIGMRLRVCGMDSTNHSAEPALKYWCLYHQQVTIVLRHPEDGNATVHRDRVILLLLARLGLRASKAVRMRLAEETLDFLLMSMNQHAVTPASKPSGRTPQNYCRAGAFPQTVARMAYGGVTEPPDS